MALTAIHLVMPRESASCLRWWALAAVVLLVLNVWYFLARSWEDNYVPSNYATIYIPTDVPVVQAWKHTPTGVELEVKWDAPVEGWKILRDGEPYAENEGRNPYVPITEGDMTRYNYEAVPQPESLRYSLKFLMNSIPASYSDEVGLPRPDAYYIRTNSPNARFEQYPVAHWIDDYSYLGEEALAEIDRVLREEVGLEDSDSELVKLEKIMVHLREYLNRPCRGTPTQDTRWMNPWEIYHAMKSGETKGWCTQFGQIYIMLANRAGLQTRMVITARTVGNNTIFTGHTWHEAWISEQGRWAWGDPAHGLVYATDRLGQVLNTVELHRLRQHAAWDGVNARAYKDWEWTKVAGEENTMVTANFAEIGQVVENQFNVHAIFKWRQPPNFEEIRNDYDHVLSHPGYFLSSLKALYFRPHLAYADYPMEGAYLYHIRHLLLWGFVLALLGWLWSRKRG